jgi:hypothetical protein
MTNVLRTADKNFDLVLESRRTDVFLNKVSRDEASRAFPAFARIAENKNNLKMLRMLFLQSFKFFTKEDILLSHIGVKQFEFCIVAFVGESMVEDLVERGAAMHVSLRVSTFMR